MTLLSINAEEELKKEIIVLISGVFDELKNKAGGDKEWMRKRDACEYLEVSNNTFTKFEAMGLKCTMISGIRRYKKSDLDKFYLTNQK